MMFYDIQKIKHYTIKFHVTIIWLATHESKASQVTYAGRRQICYSNPKLQSEIVLEKDG